MRDIGRERLVISVSSMCIIEKAYELALNYANERMAFGKPLIKNQEIRHVLANAKVKNFKLEIIENLFLLF